MPELPDVQVFKEYLDSVALHRQIDKVRVRRPDILASSSPRSLQRRLKGKSFEAGIRHGKFLFVQLNDDGWLVLHFGMTGYLEYSQSETLPEHTRVEFRFADGSKLAYVCPRMLGTVDWTADREEFVRQKRLGIDALSRDLDSKRFGELIGSKRGAIKTALMDQETIAGLGNVYSDEILFQSGVHPKSEAAKLSKASLKKIHQQLRRVTNRAIRARCAPGRMPNSFLVPRRGQNDARCPKCGGALNTIKVSGRTTYLCPNCQKV